MAAGNKNRNKNAGHKGTVYRTQRNPREFEARNINLDQILTSDAADGGSKKQRNIRLAIVAGVVATAVILGVFLSKRNGKDGDGNGMLAPSLAPSHFATDTTQAPSAPADDNSDRESSLSPVGLNSTDSVPTQPPFDSPSSCVIPSDVLNTARYNLDTELLGDSECQTNPCVIDVESLQEYSEMKEACKEADGSFHVFSVALACSNITLQFNDYPDCFVSQTQNPQCTRDYLEAYMDFLWDQDNGNCTTTSSETEVIDFSGATDVPTAPPAFPTSPPAFPTDSPAAPTDSPTNPISEKPDSEEECLLMSERGVSDAVDDLDSELISYIEDCLSPQCIIDVNSTQAFIDLKDACKQAKGAFREYAFKISCSQITFEFNNFPVCGISKFNNSACNSGFFADSLEAELDVDNCTETATHIRTTDFYSG
jgi:hypothetical protein